MKASAKRQIATAARLDRLQRGNRIGLEAAQIVGEQSLEQRDRGGMLGIGVVGADPERRMLPRSQL